MRDSSFSNKNNNSKGKRSSGTTGTTASSAAPQQQQMNAFRTWVHGLTWEEMQSAMALSFPLDPAVAAAAAAATTLGTNASAISAASASFSSMSSSGNAELDLLREMIRLQVPSPTPIHGRAIPYPAVASANKWSDGRDEAERIRRDREQRPRLFLWRHQQQQQQGTSGSDELAAFELALAMESSGSKSSSPKSAAPSRRGKGGRHQHRHHKSAAAASTTPAPAAPRYDVHARKFLQPNGERLSVGSTWEQQQADSALLRHSMLGESPTGQVVTLELACPLSLSLLSLASLDSGSNNDDDDDAATARFVKRILTVASRGRFLSKLPATTSASVKVTNTKQHTVVFHSPWLDPTEDWFSLPMYLASRFELALWESFCTTNQQSSSCWWPGIDTLLSEAELARALAKTMAHEIRNNLQTVKVPVLMDSLVWDLFADNVTTNSRTTRSSSNNVCNQVMVDLFQSRSSSPSASSGSKTRLPPRHGLSSRLLQSVVFCPLTEIGSRHEHLQRAARRSIQQLYIQANEQFLIQQEEEDQQKPTTTAITSNSRNSKARKRRRRRKKASASGPQPNQPVTTTTAAATPAAPAATAADATTTDTESAIPTRPRQQQLRVAVESEHVSSSSSSSDETADSSHRRHSDGDVRKKKISFPDNNTPTRDRNRNIVMALAVMDQVLEAVFDQVLVVVDDNDGPPPPEPEQQVLPQQQGKEEEEVMGVELLHPVVSVPVAGADERVEVGTKAVNEQVQVLAPQAVPGASGARGEQRAPTHCGTEGAESVPVPLCPVTSEAPDVEEEDEDELLMCYSAAASVALSCGEKGSDASRSTQSPTLSPILLSLSGLSEMRKDSKEQDGVKMPSVVRSVSSVSALSLPGASELRSSHHQMMMPATNTAVSPGRGVDDAREGDTEKITAVSQGESLDTSSIREERDSYRDMCLTLGAEVAKLKNMLAAQKGTTHGTNMDFSPTRSQFYRSHGSFDPESLPQAFDIVPRARTLAAMSDAGFRGEHESQASEDDAARLLRAESSRHLSSVATAAGSDVSVDHGSNHGTSHHHPAASSAGGAPFARVVYDPVSLHGMQSRLTSDIHNFLEATDLRLQKQEPRRQNAIVRMTRLVNTVWPRAQVKMYGSIVTRLSLPSSDLDFVICLPAVHKNTLAVAPGVLEGRNAINETSQKLLARTLSEESWIDPRSMKLIERTPVPVIKVSTKGPRSRALQLDITFDSPGHHGLAALHMVSQVMDELPMLRPLVIVLKQFLNNRGLLTSYTGGLSSYGLFLMVARYLQEQPSSWGDCGSLLMGFLDFYGNNFDPRSTGISVRHRRYFARQTNAGVVHGGHTASPLPAAWRPLGLGSPSTSFRRRNSFSLDVEPNASENSQRLPYTLDPLWLEDPLNQSNNVGRNAFRILSVLRAFSDAHRALVASLEWDMQSAGDFHDDGGKYPLLKCLLQNEDVVFGL